MQNFDIKRNARRCCQTDKPFRPGDCFYSELVETEDGQLERKDYAADQWSGMAENAIGWWKQTVPQLESGKIYWAPEVLQQNVAPERIKQLEEQLCENLFSDQPFVEDDAED